MKGGNRFDKESKLARKIKKSRLIIRNLCFDVTEEEIRNSFSSFGNITEVNCPKKEDGKSKGFAFISFDNVGSSLRAIKHVNGKKIKGRPVAVDFSLPKNAYSQLNTVSGNNDQKEEEEPEEESEEVELETSKTKTKKYSKYSDVSEEKTVFIRNVDLESSEESLSELMASFGQLEYCKICIDGYTGKSRGTAFVKFRKKEEAQACIEASGVVDNAKLRLDGQQLNVTLAVARNQVEQLQDANRLKHKDKRNLYLAKEGLIYPNSPAAAGVSQADLKKRLALEEKKRQLLQNYHYFISDRRLCVHNLPPNYGDKELKSLFLKAAGDAKATIVWAKVMRNRSKVDNKFAASKGFGFVEFAEHQHALKAVRFLNNNPEIFTTEKRPIVEFSVENMVALNRKKYRLIKQEKLKQQQNSTVEEDGGIDSAKKKRKNSAKKINHYVDGEKEESGNYTGVMAKPVQKGEKLHQPKMNRKMSIVKKDLLKRGKELKANQVKKQNLERHQRKKSKKEKFGQKRPVEEEEAFDSHYKKRKHIFTDTPSGVSSVSKSAAAPIKTKKWFNK